MPEQVIWPDQADRGGPCGPGHSPEKRKADCSPAVSAARCPCTRDARSMPGALPNQAVLDQGGACGAAGPAPAPGLWPWEAPPGRTPGHTSQNAQIKMANDYRHVKHVRAVFLRLQSSNSHPQRQWSAQPITGNGLGKGHAVATEPFPPWLCVADLQYVDGLGEQPGAPRTAAQLTENSPGLELRVRALAG